MKTSSAHLSRGITAFLDVLGLSERVLAVKSKEDVERLIADIVLIQRRFEFKTRDRHVKEAQILSKKTVFAFSDSVVVNLALSSKLTESYGTFDTVMDELSYLALGQAECVASGLFLRGGVDLGWWYSKGTVLASGSLVGAYRAEATAIMPVIRLSDDLYSWLSAHPDRKHYSAQIEPVRNMLRKYSGIGRDKEPISFWYIDYISVAVESLDQGLSGAQREKYLRASAREKDHILAKTHGMRVRNWLRNHAQKIRQAHARANDVGVRAKYEWLAEYHNKVALKYTSSPLAVCKLRVPKG